MEDMPKIILTVSVTMIIFAVGFFAFFVVNDEIGYTKENVQDYAVTDPSVAQACETTYFIESVKQVQQFNGIVWVTVDPTEWSQTGTRTVTVQPGGLQG